MPSTTQIDAPLRERADLELVSSSPIDTRRVVGRFIIDPREVDLSVSRSRSAQSGWEATPLADRLALLQGLKRELSARKDALSALLTEEIGKPRWEARAEVDACVSKVDITVREGLALVGDVHLESLGASYTHRALGVLAIIGPYNFPLHLVHGHVVAALMTGNTVVVKPSELAPAVSQAYAECVAAAGFPADVFQLVQGDGKVGARLAAHPDVNGVLFTGSYGVGRSIEQAAALHPGKLVALEMGGKNPAIVCEDANLEKAAYDVAWGAYVTAGQRCSGTALCLVSWELRERFVDAVLTFARAMTVGDPVRDDVFMGPVVSKQARRRASLTLQRARAEGARLLWEGTLSDAPAHGAFMAPTLHDVDRLPAHAEYFQDELFAPDLGIRCVRSVEEAVAFANALPYGLSVSVHTQSEARFAEARAGLKFGNINWNAPTCGASSRLPFGGLRKSGNYRPAGLFSPLYCTYPASTLVGASTFERAQLSPGIRL